MSPQVKPSAACFGSGAWPALIVEIIITITITITGDGRVLGSYVLDNQRKVDLALDVSGVRTMTISAIKTAGTCGSSNYGYGVLGQVRLD